MKKLRRLLNKFVFRGKHMHEQEARKDFGSVIIDRRSVTTLKSIIATVTAALIIAIITGYVSNFTQTTKLTLLAENAERRMNMMEQSLQQQEKDNREWQLSVARHGQMLESLMRDVLEVKIEYRNVTRGSSTTRK